MRKYSVIDLLRYHRLAKENKEVKPMDMIKLYNETYPELTEEEKLNNLKEFFFGCTKGMKD